MVPFSVLLVSTYELGRQPFGLAWPAAWLRRAGANVVMNDLAVEPLDREAARNAALVAFYLPMHTATRLAGGIIGAVRELQPRAHLAAYGVYAPLNESWLRSLGVESIFGGEAERPLTGLAVRLSGGALVAPDPAAAPPVPLRDGLPGLSRYARLALPDGGSRLAGYTEATRGCRHRCRHCPIVPVYDGRFRAVPRDVVLADIDAQVAAGAAHLTFGDPDFLNGPRHALQLSRELAARHPGLSWDMTAKVSHIVEHAALLGELAANGLVLVTSAVETIDDHVLERLGKGHTRADFERAIAIADRAGVALNLTFLPFTPWTTARGYAELLDFIADRDLVHSVAPVQLALRLLLPDRSPLLEIEEVRRVVRGFDPASLLHRWDHPDPEVDRLQHCAMATVRTGIARGESRAATFASLRELADASAGTALEDRVAGSRASPGPARVSRAAIPFLTEPWYC